MCTWPVRPKKFLSANGPLNERLTMNLQGSQLTKFGGLAAATLVRCWMSNLEFRGAFYDETVDPAHEDFQPPAIFLFWHEYIPFLFSLRGHCSIAMLVSQHRDAELLSAAARHMGFDIVRGSTNRGGAAALREMLRKSRNMNLAITPDGPRGPRRRLAAGCVYLSSRLEIPLVAVGLGYSNPWRLRTWDRFAIPRPYSRARGIVSPRIQIPPNLHRDDIEHYRQRVETLLNRLTTAAEDWAESGRRMQGERPAHRQPAPIKRKTGAVAPDETLLPYPALRRSA